MRDRNKWAHAARLPSLPATSWKLIRRTRSGTQLRPWKSVAPCSMVTIRTAAGRFALTSPRKLPLKAEITDPPLRRYIDERSVVLEEVPQMVQLNHDPTCNLACPSCRTEIITAKADEQ